MLVLEDIFIDVPLDKLPTEESIYKSAIWNTGLIAIDADLSAKVSANDGRVFQSRYWQDLPMPDDTSNIGYPDDGTSNISTNKLTHNVFQMHKNGPVTSWADREILRVVGHLEDPLGVVVDRLQFFWGRYFDQYALAQLAGIIANNISNNGGDMVNDISNSSSAADNTNSISGPAIIDTLATSGDSYDDYTIMICHSVVMATLRKQNLIDFIPASDGKTTFPFYQGLRVWVSDNVPVDTSGSHNTYKTIFSGPNTFIFGQTRNGIVPIEIWRDPRKGNGGGETWLISRQHFALHPIGHNWTDNNVNGSTSAGTSIPIYPNLADQRLASSWTRVAMDRKQVRVAVLESNA